jgi:hypothetical protein
MPISLTRGYCPRAFVVVEVDQRLETPAAGDEDMEVHHLVVVGVEHADEGTVAPQDEEDFVLLRVDQLCDRFWEEQLSVGGLQEVGELAGEVGVLQDLLGVVVVRVLLHWVSRAHVFL